MKRFVKAAEMSEEEKISWLENAAAEELLHQYDSLHIDTIKGFSYNPDFELTRNEVLKRLRRA